MTNHPNRGPKGPTSNPAPETIRAAREAAGMTQTESALLVHASLRAWQQWEAGDRRMPPGLWSLFRIRSMLVDDAAAAFTTWWGEQPALNDTVDEAAQSAWLAAFEWMQTTTLPATAGGEIRPTKGHHKAKGNEMKTRIVVDEENNAEKFWEHAQSSADTPEELRGFGDSITVSNERAKEIESWCKAAHGFADGPDHAPTALLFVDEE